MTIGTGANFSNGFLAAAAANPTTTITEGRIVRQVPNGANAGRVERATAETQIPLGVASYMDDRVGGAVGVVQHGRTYAEYGGVVQPGGAVMSDANGACVAAVGPCWVLGFHVGTADSAAGVDAMTFVNPFYTDAVGSV
ncbi:MAG: hypothetical protein Q8Q14_00555 [Gemmatimonadales bacterium]|nr:hypothetical protein [Gemmatimonadales bacterium]